MDLIAIGVIALAFVILLLPRREKQDRVEQKGYRENWVWPPK